MKGISSCFKHKLCLVVCLLVCMANRHYAQCTGCTTVITSNSSTNYTVNAGAVLCINAGVVHTGTIRLNGGSVCNNGTVTAITFLSGTFDNYNTLLASTSLTANITSTTTINCYPLSTFTTSGSLSMQASAVTVPMTINILKGAQFRLGGSLTHSRGRMTINVGVTGSNPTGAQTLLNIGGNASASFAELTLINEARSLVNIDGSFALNNTYNKTLTNRGTFNITSFFNMAGNASGNGVVTVNNTGNFSVGDFLTAAVSNATVNIINDGVFTVNSSLTLGAANHTFVNHSIVRVNFDVILSAGSLTNNKSLTVRDLDVRAAQATNNGELRISRNLLANTSTGTVNNNAFIDIFGKLSNRARLNLAAKSLIRTDSCINTTSTATIIGAPSAGTGFADYARLVIKGGSRTDGYIQNYVLVHDLTLVSTASNVNLGFDQVTNPSRIANTAVFAARGKTPVGSPPVINCGAITAGYVLQALAKPPTICAGACTSLEAHLYQIIPTGSSGQSYLSEVDLVGFTWQPGGLSGQYVTVCPTSSTNYVVSITYLGCVFTTNVQVNIITSNIVVNTGPTILLNSLPSSPIVIPAFVSGGAGALTYNWSPVGNLSSNTVLNPILTFPTTPSSYPLSYNLNVIDAQGCTGSSNLNVYYLPSIPNKEHYAILNRELDAGYYNTVLNGTNKTLFFMFEEEYKNTLGGTLSYTVLDNDNLVYTTIPSMVKKIGDNRFALNVSAISPALVVGQYYKLIVKNEKEEIWQGRFKVN